MWCIADSGAYILESVYISACSELIFFPLFFQVEQRALLLQMPAVSFSSFYSFIFFIFQFPNELVYKVQVLSIA